jgi:predicted nucleotidyltransferase
MSATQSAANRLETQASARNAVVRIRHHLDISMDAVEGFCRRWHVLEMSLFGSVLRDDFGPESDVDVLVVLDPEAAISLFDLVRMRDELVALFGREVDLVEKAALVNPFRRKEILKHCERVYAA